MEEQMKHFTVLVLLLICTFSSNAQILNGGFETWANGSPADWFPNNIPPLAVSITQTGDAHSGSSAVRGEVVAFMSGFLPPLIQAGNFASGFLISEKYYTFKGYFKFNPVGADILGINVVMYNGSDIIGSGSVERTSSISSYTEINVPVSYIDNRVPNKMIMQVFIAGSGSQDPNIGSVFFADDFQMSTSITGINDQVNELSFILEQNYPNPFNPVTKIKYSIPVSSEVVFTVYNSLGKEICKEISFKEAGSHNINFRAEGLSSGVYFYNITAGEFTATRKLILLK
jgi:hypothetical protein